MSRLTFCLAMIIGALGGPVLAQTSPSTVATALPAPPVSEDADAAEFLRDAERALAAGREGEAQQSLEMAQTRLLDRSVPLGSTRVPSDSPSVNLVSQALQALVSGDRMNCLRLIHAAQQAVSQH
jgi:hypothetical protein